MTFFAKSMNIVFGSMLFPEFNKFLGLETHTLKVKFINFGKRVNFSLILVDLSMLPRKKDNGLRFGNSKHGNTNLG